MTTLETLKAARAKIADRKHWTQEYLARDKRSRGVEPSSPTACRWCAVGAVKAVAGTRGGLELALSALRATSRTLLMVGLYNDTHSHAEVVALFDNAIAKLEGGGK